MRTPQGAVEYEGEARIDGVPGTAAPIALEFLDVAGSSCGSLLPTGAVTDTFEGIELTCIDNGMPVIIVRAADLGVTGAESPAQLEANAALVAKVEKHPPEHGAAHEPRRCGAQDRPEDLPGERAAPWRIDRHGHVHSASRARGHRRARRGERGHRLRDSGLGGGPGGAAQADAMRGASTSSIRADSSRWTWKSKRGRRIVVRRAALLRTARKLMRGDVFVPGAIWSRA